VPEKTAPSSAKSVDPLKLPGLLRPSIEAAAGAADKRGDLPEELYAELRESGAFRLLTPRELGGSETPLSTVLKVYEGFGRIDASVAWLVWNANFGFVAALLEEAGVARVWGAGPEPVFANSGQPGGAVPVEGGFRLTGQWKIVSGIHAADWVVVLAVVIENGAPRMTPSGMPDIRLFTVHQEQLTVQETWNVNGMRATGSHDVLIEDAFVPDDLVARLDTPSRIQRPLYQGFIPALVFPGCTAVVLGVAQAAIEEMVRLARTKRTFTGETLAEAPHTQSVIARSEAALKAARLLLFSAVASLEASAERQEQVTLEQRADLRAAMSHAAGVCREVLVAMYELGSSSSLYYGSPLERLFRDGMVALQHANHSAKFLEIAGRVRLGIDPGVPLF
jgi:alkylation response protein AidB-like acyl-CoA dehydrogenase